LNHAGDGDEAGKVASSYSQPRIDGVVFRRYIADVSVTTASKWSDDSFLNQLRGDGDAEADACLDQLGETRESFAGLFRFLNSNQTVVPDGAPEALKTFFATCLHVPTPDGIAPAFDRLRAGEQVFQSHACCAALVLLANSLPAGYAAPNLSKVLVLSGDLKTHPYKRLLGVLQMIVNVTASNGFDPAGKAVVTAAKLRLLHAGVRRIARHRMPDYDSRFGVPVNHEDMLGTLMGFSLLVIRGLQELGVGLTNREAEDYYYLWRTFGLAMGIHPRGAPNSTEYLPATLAEAREFYRAYERRHYRDAHENPEGVELTRACLMMLEEIVAHTPFRRLGVTKVPRVYMQRMLGAAGLIQRGVEPIPGHPIMQWMLLTPLRVWTWIGSRADGSGWRHFHDRLAEVFFQGLINRTLDGEVTFLIPERLQDLHALTDPVIKPYGERRRGERRVQQSPPGIPERRRHDRRLAFRAGFWGYGSGIRDQGSGIRE
jgi:hypothetical protein